VVVAEEASFGDDECRYGTFAVAEYSSALSQEQRTGIIEGMRQGAVSVLVCSDAFARGMDFADVQVGGFFRALLHPLDSTPLVTRDTGCH
jgi:superfamily II DNA/RNA helicase